MMRYNFDEIIDRRGTACIKYDAMKDFIGADDVIPMWVADMDFKTPAFIVEALKKRLEHEVYAYSIRPKSYFLSIKEWLYRRHQWKVDTDWMVFTPGVVPAINIAVLALTLPGDGIIVQPPVYFPFFSAATDHGRKLIYNPLVIKDGRLCMDFENLEMLAKEGAKMLILSNPHNPAGSAWTADELTRLATICLKYNIIVLSDEIHCDLVLKPFKHVPLAGISEEFAQNCITTIAPSKTFNLSGLSTSTAIIQNDEMREKFVKMLDSIHIGLGNIAGNIASEAAYQMGDEWLDQLIEYLGANADYLFEFLDKEIPSIKMLKPEATYLVWLDCRDLELDNTQLSDLFQKDAKLGLNPGFMFGPGGDGFMRMNIACPKSVLIQACIQLKSAVEIKLLQKSDN